MPRKIVIIYELSIENWSGFHVMRIARAQARVPRAEILTT